MKVALIIDTLTDQSKVYGVCINDGTDVIDVDCPTLGDADRLITRLVEAFNLSGVGASRGADIEKIAGMHV